MEKITELFSGTKGKDAYIKEAKKAADIVDKGIIKDSGKRNKFLSFSVGDRKKQINWDGEIPQKTFSMSMDICLSKKIKQFQPFVLLDSSGNQYILYNSISIWC